MTDREIIATLHQVGDLEGMCPAPAARFKARAFHQAAVALAQVNTPLRSTALTEVPHVGAGVAAVVRELLQTGKCARLTELRATATPQNEKDAALLALDAKTYRGVLSMTRVRGLGPKKALALYQTTGLKSFTELVAAAKNGRLLRNVDGVNAKLVAAVLEAAAQKHERVPLALALPIIREFKRRLAALPGVTAVSEAGSARRRCETIGDLDLLVAVQSKHAAAVVREFQRMVPPERRGVAGTQKARIVWDLGAWGKLQIDLLVVSPKEWGAALNYFTGSKAWNIAVRKRAKRRGCKISEHGYFKGSKRVGGAKEGELFDLLDIPWTPPMQREGDELPKQSYPIVQPDEMAADWHVHTKWSDGHGTPEQMVKAALARGLKLIAITDHSYSVRRRFAAYVKELRRVQKRYADRISVLVGVEVDINRDGTLALSEAQLKQLDMVIASIHRQHAEKVEARLLAAIKHPLVTILGHPTGRQFASGKTAREIPANVNWRALFKAAATWGCALEINAQPSRMDLPADLLRQAAVEGCQFAVGSDAHDPDGVGRLQYAHYLVRKARLRRRQLCH
jgi:DNA polymerase (family 10)